jgi:hypothetical protein
MLGGMNPMFDAFWRAVAYCLHPRVVALSLLPLVLMAVVALGLGYFFWDAAVAGMDAWLSSLALVERLSDWLGAIGLPGLRSVLAPVVVLGLVTPVLVVACLLAVAWLMTPSLVQLVGERRFASLQRRESASWWASAAWTLGATVLALLALLLSMPLWLIPPLVLVLPPLIWGWLTYRVFTLDALAAHASAAERQQILREHRLPLLAMGVLCGYLGAAPTLIWASGAMWVVLAPLLIPLAVWLYTLVLAFSSLWFVHYALAALERLRAVPLDVPPPVSVSAAAAPSPLLDLPAP